VTPTPQETALTLAGRAADALLTGAAAQAASYAGQAADAFLREQGGPTFDVVNMLRLRAQAQLAADPHAAEATLDRAGALGAALPDGPPFDRLRDQLEQLGAAAADQRSARGSTPSRSPSALTRPSSSSSAPPGQ
jgi:hypothetical protein